MFASTVLLTGPDGMGGIFVRPQCTFSVTLDVSSKHTDGGSWLPWLFDRDKTPPFALELS